MVVARAFDSPLGRMVQAFSDWLNVRDYDRATEEATDRIVKKQSRGSIYAQNGWYMTRAELEKSSKQADSHIHSLRKHISATD